MSKQLKIVKGQVYDYELYNLVDNQDPILLTKLSPYIFDTNPKDHAKYVAISLLETMKHNNGVGLAANQCGLPYRVFVVGAEGVGFAFFNPEILETTGEVMFEEGCLSYKGLFLPIRRPETVRIKYQDFNAEWQEKTFTGFTARIVLHEYDHMEGIVFVNKVPRLILDRAKMKVGKNLKILSRQRVQDEKNELIRRAVEKLALEAKKKTQSDQELSSNT
jgi:peptide deformylase